MKCFFSCRVRNEEVQNFLVCAKGRFLGESVESRYLVNNPQTFLFVAGLPRTGAAGQSVEIYTVPDPSLTHACGRPNVATGVAIILDCNLFSTL
jgi:hypothetical protein